MTQTIAVIVNAALAAGIVAALAYVMRTPFRLHRPRGLTRAVYAPRTDEHELSRAA
jgi:hypothetical protein